MGYKKRQKGWIKKHDVRVGDFVKFLYTREIREVFEIQEKSIECVTGNRHTWLRYDEIKKITDLKDLAPFYIKIDNEEQSKKVQEICFSHGIEWTWPMGEESSYVVVSEGEYLFCDDNYYKITWDNSGKGEDDYYRQLTYDQILRFEKNSCSDWAPKSNINLPMPKVKGPIEEKITELIDKKLEKFKQQFIESLRKII